MKMWVNDMKPFGSVNLIVMSWIPRPPELRKTVGSKSLHQASCILPPNVCSCGSLSFNLTSFNLTSNRRKRKHEDGISKLPSWLREFMA